MIEANDFTPLIKILGRGKSAQRSLTEQEAEHAMSLILAGKASAEQIGAFLMLMRVKEETSEELIGFTRATQQAIPFPTLNIDFDWPSYAGKRHHNHWYLLATLCLAQQGYRIFMHGTAGTQTEKTYSSTIGEQLGIKTVDNWQTAQEHLSHNNIAYMPTHAIQPQLAHLLELRALFDLRSPMHSLVRILNPSQASCAMQGIFHPRYAARHQTAAIALGINGAAAFKGEGGEAEIRPDATTKIAAVRGGKTSTEEWPRQFDGKQPADGIVNSYQLKDFWNETIQHSYGLAAVQQTMAVALWIKHPKLAVADAQQQAQQLWKQRREL